MRFVFLFPCLALLAICVAALPPAKRGMPAFKHTNLARNYETRAMFGWGARKEQTAMQRGNASKIESKGKLISALLLCQEDCARIWDPADPSPFWSDCNECCRKIGDAVAYC